MKYWILGKRARMEKLNKNNEVTVGKEILEEVNYLRYVILIFLFKHEKMECEIPEKSLQGRKTNGELDSFLKSR